MYAVCFHITCLPITSLAFYDLLLQKESTVRHKTILRVFATAFY